MVLCIDVEPDGRALDPQNPGGWDGFLELMRAFVPLRERLSEASGTRASFSWFVRMDPQIERTWGTPAWVIEQWGAVLAALERDGDELGLHTHDWRWHDDVGGWVAVHDDPAWEEHVVEFGLQSFRAALGRRATVHRGGCHNLTAAMLKPLAASGVEVDLTVEPGLAPSSGVSGDERSVGLSPDYRLAPAVPYRASAETFPAPDPTSRSAPLLMPVASAPGRRGKRAPLSIGARPWAFPARLALGTMRSQPPVLAFPIRTSFVFLPEWAYITANIEHLAARRGACFVTASTAAEPFLASG